MLTLFWFSARGLRFLPSQLRKSAHAVSPEDDATGNHHPHIRCSLTWIGKGMSASNQNVSLKNILLASHADNFFLVQFQAPNSIAFVKAFANRDSIHCNSSILRNLPRRRGAFERFAFVWRAWGTSGTLQSFGASFGFGSWFDWFDLCWTLPCTSFGVVSLRFLLLRQSFGWRFSSRFIIRQSINASHKRHAKAKTVRQKNLRHLCSFDPVRYASCQFFFMFMA